MIFNNNGTSLSSNIPMAEGYDGTVGAAWALVESARNDYAMFRGMLDIDAREYNIQQESAGYVAESQIAALHEAATGGIWGKIKQVIEKFITKIKAIIHKFVAKFNSLTMSGKQLVKKYGNEVLRKRNIDKLEVKWRKLNSGKKFNEYAEKMEESPDQDIIKHASLADSEKDNTWKKVTKKITADVEAENATEYREGLSESLWEDDKAETYEISETDAKNMRTIVTYVQDFDKKISDLQKSINKCLNAWNNLIKLANKNANNKATDYRNANPPTDGSDDNDGKNNLIDANNAYEAIVVEHDAYTVLTSFQMDTYKTYYAQCKAAFMKGISVSEKKLESGVYDDEYATAIAEAAADEVEDVISGALSSEELSDLTAASKNVMDADVTNDPDKLTYGPDCYTEPKSSPYSRADGSIDASIVGRNESTLFDFKLV